MASVSTYLTFTGDCGPAFETYKAIFGTEYVGEPARYGGMPPSEGMPELAENEKDLILNIQLPILGGHLLMGSDVMSAWSEGVVVGNNVQICLHPDTREEADRLYTALSDGGKADMPMADQFWGDYYGELTDKYSIKWLVAHTPAS